MPFILSYLFYKSIKEKRLAKKDVAQLRQELEDLRAKHEHLAQSIESAGPSPISPDHGGGAGDSKAAELPGTPAALEVPAEEVDDQAMTRNEVAELPGDDLLVELPADNQPACALDGSHQAALLVQELPSERLSADEQLAGLMYQNHKAAWSLQSPPDDVSPDSKRLEFA